MCTDVIKLDRISNQSMWNNTKSVDIMGALLVPVVVSEVWILFQHYHGCKWYLLADRLENNFKILSHIPVNP